MHGTPGTTSPARGTQSPVIEPIFCSPVEAANALGLSKREVYRLLDQDEIKSTRKGRRRLVVIESVRAFAQRLLEEAA